MLLKQFFRFTLPSILAMWIFSLYTMVDGIFVAHGVGEYALAAVNLSMPYTILIFSISLLIATGSSTLASIFLGEGKPEKANQLFNQNLALLTVGGILISVITVLNLDKIALLLGASEETFEYVKGYLGWIAVFAVFFMVSYYMEIYVKTDGSPLVQTIGVFSGGLINVILDYIFVIRLHLGVEGAAVATGLSQIAATVIFLCYFKFHGKKLSFGTFKPDFKVYRRLIPLGMADSFTELSGGIVILLFNRIILLVIGSKGIICYTVISYLNTLALNCMSGIAQGAQPLISFNYGAEKQDNCQRLLKYALRFAAFSGALFVLISELAPHILMGLFFDKTETELIQYGTMALRLYGISFALMGLNVVSAGYFTAIERPAFSLTISLSRSLVLLSACLIAMAALFGERGIWLSTAVSEGLTLFITITFFMRYRKSISLSGSYCKISA